MKCFIHSYTYIQPEWRSWDFIVGIVIGHRLDNWGIVIWFQAGTEDLSLLQSVQTGPLILFSGDTRGFFCRDKMAMAWSWPWVWSSAEFKNEWSYTSSPPCGCVACTRRTLPFIPWHTLLNCWKWTFLIQLNTFYKCTESKYYEVMSCPFQPLLC